MATTYLTRVFGTPTNGKKFTFSAWMKKGTLSGDQAFFSTGNSSDPITTFRWNSDGKIYLFYLSSSSMVWEFATNSLYRDCNGWYNVVIAFDSTESSAGDRLKLWVNGEQITTWSTQVNPALDMTPTMNTAVRHDLGTNGPGGNYFTGLMSHVHFVDGTAYPASTFGSTDATTGNWKINTNPTVTYGDNGFFLLKNDASLTDQSGEGNNFTLGGGTLTKTEDNPSNVFATLNPTDVMKQSGGIYVPTFSNGNLTIAAAADYNYQTFGTISPETGKWYWEMKIDVANTTGHRLGVFFGNDKTHSGSYYYGANAFYIHQNGQIYYNGSNTVYMSSYTAGDIISVALDVTNGNIYMSKNGGASDSTWADGSGNNNQAFPGTSINGKLGASWISGPATPFFDVYGTGNKESVNFGNGYFGTSAVSSAGTNASNIGIFEYDVPTGYTALSTKGLNL